MRPTRFLTSAMQTVEESKRELCLNEFIKFKTLLALHIALYISVFSSVSVALCFSLVIITMGKQQKWQFKREKYLSTWLNTQMSFRTWLPCVHTRLSGHTLSISYSNLLYMGKYVWPNEGRADLACMRVWECAFDSYPCFITADSDMKPQQHLFSLSFILLLFHRRAHAYHCAVEQYEPMQCEGTQWMMWNTSYITSY